MEANESIWFGKTENNARNVAKDMEGKARWKENRTERKRFNLPKM